ncbi:MAG TPA: hypothetical protein VFC47_09375 [Caulobacteraceae bacterium]|nr:hypothetical protein [Caulobacteraceae bacterium]
MIALTPFGMAKADAFKEGAAAYQRGDFETAMRIWRPQSERGSADAQQALGFMYELGCCGAAWLRRAAELRACRDLGA